MYLQILKPYIYNQLIPISGHIYFKEINGNKITVDTHYQILAGHKIIVNDEQIFDVEKVVENGNIKEIWVR